MQHALGTIEVLFGGILATSGESIAVHVLIGGGVAAWWVSLDGQQAGVVTVADDTLRLTPASGGPSPSRGFGPAGWSGPGGLGVVAGAASGAGRGRPMTCVISKKWIGDCLRNGIHVSFICVVCSTWVAFFANPGFSGLSAVERPAGIPPSLLEELRQDQAQAAADLAQQRQDFLGQKREDMHRWQDTVAQVQVDAHALAQAQAELARLQAVVTAQQAATSTRQRTLAVRRQRLLAALEVAELSQVAAAAQARSVEVRHQAAMRQASHPVVNRRVNRSRCQWLLWAIGNSWHWAIIGSSVVY